MPQTRSLPEGEAVVERGRLRICDLHAALEQLVVEDVVDDAVLDVLVGELPNLLVAKRPARVGPVAGGPGMVTIRYESELACFKGKLESSLVRFVAHDCVDGPRQRRAF